MFDPHAFAADHGVTVQHVPDLPDLGRYYPGKHLVVLRSGLDTITERCTLTHELGHHHYGHYCSSPRAEALADRWASNRLITTPAIVECAMIWPDNPEKWCHHLEVTPTILRAWLAQPRNYAAAERRLTRKTA